MASENLDNSFYNFSSRISINFISFHYGHCLYRKLYRQIKQTAGIYVLILSLNQTLFLANLLSKDNYSLIYLPLGDFCNFFFTNSKAGIVHCQLNLHAVNEMNKPSNIQSFTRYIYCVFEIFVSGFTSPMSNSLLRIILIKYLKK